MGSKTPQRRTKATAAAIATAAALLLAACGSEGNETINAATNATNSPTTTETGESSNTTAPSAQPSTSSSPTSPGTTPGGSAQPSTSGSAQPSSSPTSPGSTPSSPGAQPEADTNEPEPSPTWTGIPGGNTTPSSPATPTPDTDLGCQAYAPYQGHQGKKVTLLTSIQSPQKEGYVNSWKEFTECTGITIEYLATNSIENDLRTRLQSGPLPDLAFIPQPGTLRAAAGTGKVKPLPGAAQNNLQTQYDPIWTRYGTVTAGTPIAAPLSVNAKSLVWYDPNVFAKNRIQVPRSWSEMLAITKTLRATNTGRWCAGLTSGSQTGWPATDWLESIVLRQHGPEVYDAWASGKLPFNSPQIKASMEQLQTWLKDPFNTNAGYGDPETIASTSYDATIGNVLTGRCTMTPLPSFMAPFWPAVARGPIEIAPNGDVYAFNIPGKSTDDPTQYIVAGGEFVTAFSDRPEVAAFQTYLTSKEWGTTRAAQGDGYISPNKGVPTTSYPDQISRLVAQTLTQPGTVFRYDASDTMPPAVGTDAFWKQMTAWFANKTTTDQALTAIDAAWPR